MTADTPADACPPRRLRAARALTQWQLGPEPVQHNGTHTSSICNANDSGRTCARVARLRRARGRVARSPNDSLAQNQSKTAVVTPMTASHQCNLLL